MDRWIVVYTVCASAVISPLRQWLDSYAKTRLKMWHTFKHFIHLQSFLLPTNLVIVFVHWVSTVMCCTNPDNVHCFGTIFPNLNFVFASICATRPVDIQSDQYRSCSTVKVNNVTTRDRCSPGVLQAFIPMGSNQKQRYGSEFANSMIGAWGVRGRMKQNNADLKLLENCVMNGFIIFGIICSWRPLDWRIRHSHLVSTLFHSLVPWWRPRRIRPQITRLSQLENSAMGTLPIYKNSVIPDWFEKWRDIKFWYRC